MRSRRGQGRRSRAAFVLMLAVLLAVLLAGCDTAHRNPPEPQASFPAASVPPSKTQVRPSVAAASSAASAKVGQPSAVSPAQHRTVTVLGSGDVLIHPPLWEQAAADAKVEHRAGYDFGPIYQSVAPDVRSADLAICELETPLAPAEGPFSGWPNFNAPPQVLTALKGIGYDSCTTASNHALDQGYVGVKRTLDELDVAGLNHTGSARSAAEAAKPLIITTANGVRVAQLAFAFGFNGIAVPPGQPWLANLTDVPTILAAAARAKAAGADLVVLSLHWGTEYQHAPTALQIEQAGRLLASPDVDVILGDHAHVVQPFDKIGDKWVAYGMGNQISRHADPIDDSREGVMPEFTFTEIAPHHWQVTRARAIPTWMQLAPTLRLIDLPAALADPELPAVQRSMLLKAQLRIRGYLNALGADKRGLIVGR